MTADNSFLPYNVGAVIRATDPNFNHGQIHLNKKERNMPVHQTGRIASKCSSAYLARHRWIS